MVMMQESFFFHWLTASPCSNCYLLNRQHIEHPEAGRTTSSSRTSIVQRQDEQRPDKITSSWCMVMLQESFFFWLNASPCCNCHLLNRQHIEHPEAGGTTSSSRTSIVQRQDEQRPDNLQGPDAWSCCMNCFFGFAHHYFATFTCWTGNAKSIQKQDVHCLAAGPTRWIKQGK